jgi:hypothetical protein
LDFTIPDIADSSLHFFPLQLRQHSVAGLKWILHTAEFEGP